MTTIMANPLQGVMDQVKTWARVNSPWAIHFNSGSCNGCDIEILATLTPRYDIERFGIKLQGSPRHADVLVCTGPVTLQARDRLIRIYEQMPEPKFVIVVGSCGLSGGVFQGLYGVVGCVEDVIPVHAYIPGCPPRPEAIIDGIVKLLGSLEGVTPPAGPIVDGKAPAVAPVAESRPPTAETGRTEVGGHRPEKAPDDAAPTAGGGRSEERK